MDWPVRYRDRLRGDGLRCPRRVLGAPRPACGERSDRIVRCDPGEGESPRAHLQVFTRKRPLTLTLSPRRAGRGNTAAFDFAYLASLAITRGATLLPLSAAVSAITATFTTRAITASTSSTSHWPSDSLVSRSVSRTVCCAMASAKCRPQ